MSSLSGGQGFCSIHWKLKDQLIIFLSLPGSEKCEKHTQDSNKDQKLSPTAGAAGLKTIFGLLEKRSHGPNM